MNRSRNALSVAGALVAGTTMAALVLLVPALAVNVEQAPVVSVRFVATTGADGGPCSIAEPCRTLQYAADSAPDGGEVRVATGIYTGVLARPRVDTRSTGVVSQVLYLTKSLTVRGGYTTTNWDDAWPLTQPVTISAQQKGRVAYVSGPISVTLEGLRMLNGYAVGQRGYPGDESSDAGANVYVITAALTIRNSEVVSGYAGGLPSSGYGGGMFATGANVLIEDSRIALNQADHGAGLRMINGRYVISHNVIMSNSARYGGGLYSTGVSLILARNQIVANTAIYGGGADIYSGDAQVLDNEIVRNFATARAGFSGYDGGGLALDMATATIARNVIATNTATQFGGGISVDGGAVTVQSNLIASNTCALAGGGVALINTSAGAHAVLGNLIVRNRADGNNIGAGGGGGIYDWMSSAVIANNVIADNASVYAAPGLLVNQSSPRVIHNTFARNIGAYGAIEAKVTSKFWMTNTIIISQALGVGVPAGNNSWVVLNGVLWYSNTANTNGLVTATNAYTGSPAFDIDGYHLTLASAAVDRGVAGAAVDDIDRDVRPQGAAPDLGADEVGLAATIAGRPNPVAQGSALTVTVRVTNTTGITTTVQATATLPAPVTPSGDVTWPSVDLGPRGTWSVEIGTMTQAPFTGLLTFTVRVTSTAGLTTFNYGTAVVQVPVSALSARNNSPTNLGSATTLSATANGSHLAFAWDFGDSLAGSGPVASHTYKYPGRYTAIVTASNGLNALTASTPVTVNAILTPAGGTIVMAPGVTVVVPSGAFTSSVVLDYAARPVTDTAPRPNVGIFYELGARYVANGLPASLQAGRRYTITISYGHDAVPPGADDNTLRLYYWTGIGWLREPTSVVITTTHTVRASPDHFSFWTPLMRAPSAVALPSMTRP